MVLPWPSLAVKVTVVLPTPETVLPDAGNWLTEGVPQLSALLTALYAGRVAEQLAFNAMVWAAGQVMVGAILSTRLTVNEQEAVLPLPSLAVNVTVVLPTPVTTTPNAGA